jgi:hypothetical protein
MLFEVRSMCCRVSKVVSRFRQGDDNISSDSSRLVVVILFTMNIAHRRKLSVHQRLPSLLLLRCLRLRELLDRIYVNLYKVDFESRGFTQLCLCNHRCWVRNHYLLFIPAPTLSAKWDASRVGLGIFNLWMLQWRAAKMTTAETMTVVKQVVAAESQNHSKVLSLRFWESSKPPLRIWRDTWLTIPCTPAPASNHQSRLWI